MSEPTEHAPTRSSELIAAAARHLGAHVERLSADVVICTYDGQTVAFKGMAGRTSARFGHALCRDSDALARYLTSRQIPVAVEQDPVETFDVAIVNGKAVTTRGQASPDILDPMTTMAADAVAAVPGIAYATVTLAIDSSNDLGVLSIDPRMRVWARADQEPHGADVAAEVVRAELVAA